MCDLTQILKFRFRKYYLSSKGAESSTEGGEGSVETLQTAVYKVQMSLKKCSWYNSYMYVVNTQYCIFTLWHREACFHVL